MVGKGSRDQKQSWPISTYFHPTHTHIPKIYTNTSHVTIRSAVRDLAYSFLPAKVNKGSGLRKTSGAQKTLIFATKKWVCFDIVKQQDVQTRTKAEANPRRKPLQ